MLVELLKTYSGASKRIVSGHHEGGFFPNLIFMANFKFPPPNFCIQMYLVRSVM